MLTNPKSWVAAGGRFAGREPMVHHRARRHVHSYTLVEILAAMVVLIILMGFLFKFLGTAQQAWSASDGNTRIYQNAQIAFDLIAHDLRAAVADDTQGREIPFWINPRYTTFDTADTYDDWNEQDAICFVASIEPPNSVADTRMCEVRYSLFTDDSTTTATRRKQLYWLRRSITPDETGSAPGTDNPLWNFYGVTPNANPNLDDDWTDGGDRHRIVDGVEEFSVRTLPASTGTRNRLPQAVKIKLTLVDPRAYTGDLPPELRAKMLRQTRRTFTRMIFLGGR